MYRAVCGESSSFGATRTPASSGYYGLGFIGLRVWGSGSGFTGLGFMGLRV